MKDLKTKWLPLAAVLASLWTGGMTSAQAAVCEATNSITDPDAKVTDAVACGSGTTDESYSATDVRSVENVAGYNLDWDLLEEVELANNSGSSAGNSLTFTGTQSGNWYLTTNLELNAYDFLLVIKDGGVRSGQGQSAVESPKWFWFILDETVNTSGVACGEANLCGTWSMYGKDGKLKDVSHMRIYSAPNGGTPPQEVPEPGPLSLLGLGLIGLWFARRRISF